MNLVSMLVPVETLPGWPAVETPSVLQILGLLLGVPALLALVIAGWVTISARLRAKRNPQIGAAESVWLNRPTDDLPTPEQLRSIDGRIEDAGDVPPRSAEDAAAESPGRRLVDEPGHPTGPEGPRGGASARW